MPRSDLAQTPPNLLRDLGREYAHHLNTLDAIERATEAAIMRHDAVGDRITGETIDKLKKLDADIQQSTLPEDQKAVLRRQVSEAFARHNQILETAAEEAMHSIQAIRRLPKPKRSFFGRLADEIDDTVRDLTRW